MVTIIFYCSVFKALIFVRANIINADQPAHPGSLISAFGMRSPECLLQAKFGYVYNLSCWIETLIPDTGLVEQVEGHCI